MEITIGISVYDNEYQGYLSHEQLNLLLRDSTKNKFSIIGEPTYSGNSIIALGSNAEGMITHVVIDVTPKKMILGMANYQGDIGLNEAASIFGNIVYSVSIHPQETSKDQYSTDVFSPKISSKSEFAPSISNTQRLNAQTSIQSDYSSISSETCDCSFNKYNCNSFPLSNGVTADDCYSYCKLQGKGDIHDLDRNSDGDACQQGWGE